ncbi:ubiquitin carboxyl-terminal hydrolase 1, partial [Lecanoromycetidae sp. Uapishka_2]
MSFPRGFHAPSHVQSMQTAAFNPAGISSTAVAYGVLLLISIYYILQYFDFMNLPLSELVWNSVVYITPSRLICMLDSGFERNLAELSGVKGKGFNSQAHASKSNAMRRVLGLDGAGLMTTVQRTRTLSGLGSVFKTAPKKSLPGLGNWDNSCYQNSVLQGLAALESLPAFLSQNGGADALQPTKTALRETIEKLNNPENVGQTFWTPAELKSMSSWQQQDAQEYFSKISDQLEKDTAKELQPSDDGLGETPKDSNKALRESVQGRLCMVDQALEDEDFTDQVLKKCQIPPKQRVLTTKSRQAVVARSPKCLVIHINRSNFDELTGTQSKNLANVKFPLQFDLAPWCLGEYSKSLDKDDASESWNVDPSQSMLDSNQDVNNLASRNTYQLRAVITHYGRHENGHYICYREAPYSTNSESGVSNEKGESWWQLSDDDVAEVDENMVLAQGGVFMLFYEQLNPVTSRKGDQQGEKEKAAEQFESTTSDRDDGAILENVASEPPAPVSLPRSVSEDQSATASYPTPPMSPQAPGILECNEEEVDQSATAPLEPISKSNGHNGTAAPSAPEMLPQIPKATSPKPRATSPAPPQTTQSSAPSLPPVPESIDVAVLPADQSISVPVLKENHSVSPTSMRTAGPRKGRGSVSRAGKAMESVAGFVQAN